MAASEGTTNSIMSGLKQSTINNDIRKYALFLGGTNVVHDVLQQYDPLRTGYGRLFMVRRPTFMDSLMKDKMMNFQHILEYGNTAISGLGDISLEGNTITGGYTGKGFEIPSVATDNTNTLNVTVYEFSGSPIREVLHTWINGISDLQTGLSHYNGLELNKAQYNQTAEFIYVATDHTGVVPEYVCLFANCYPKNIPLDRFNYSSGSHELVDIQIEFAATKYESVQINKVGAALLKRYQILTNSLNFNSRIGIDDLGKGKYYDYESGQLKDGDSSTQQINYNEVHNVQVAQNYD